jgi:hypothetical protein
VGAPPSGRACVVHSLCRASHGVGTITLTHPCLLPASPAGSGAEPAPLQAPLQAPFHLPLGGMEPGAAALATAAWGDHCVPLLSDLSFVMGYRWVPAVVLLQLRRWGLGGAGAARWQLPACVAGCWAQCIAAHHGARPRAQPSPLLHLPDRPCSQPNPAPGRRRPATAERGAAAGARAAAAAQLAGMGEFLSPGATGGADAGGPGGAPPELVSEELAAVPEADLDNAAFQAVMAGVLQFLHANGMWQCMALLLRLCASNGIAFTNSGEELCCADLGCDQVAAIAAEADAAGAALAAEAGGGEEGGAGALLFSHSAIDGDTIIVSAVRASPGAGWQAKGRSPCAAGAAGSGARSSPGGCSGAFEVAQRRPAPAPAPRACWVQVAGAQRAAPLALGRSVLPMLMMMLMAVLGATVAAGF